MVAVTKAASCALVCALMVLAHTSASKAQVAGGEQQHLYQQMVRQPTNYEITSKYVQVATANGDYEAAIGALERLLFYNPNLAHVKYELGTLYYRLGAFEIARRYFLEAQSSSSLDDATKQSITAYLENTNKQTQQSRFSGFAQTGLRYQSNANFGPSSNSILLGGSSLPISGRAKRAPDWNWFGVVGLSNDYDLQNQHGDILETRFLAYDSQQFKFHDVDVGLLELSIGPRMPLAPEMLPGATVKPYVVGGNTWVGSARYLTSGGAGIQVKLPLGKSLTIGPEFEWRNVDYNSTAPTPTDTFASGNIFTGGISSQLAISEQAKLESKGYYRRGLASNSFQTYDQWVGEAALTLQLPSPIPTIPSWSVSPFGRYIRTTFESPNPYIDPLTVRIDNEWVAGMTFNALFTGAFGISATVQYDRTNSTLPNYREDNFSVMAGPTARF
jgi:hypothetical protein